MMIAQLNTTEMGIEHRNHRGLEAPGRARCSHCHREFRATPGFRQACRNCKAEDDDRSSFEAVLALNFI
jgi:hypothetical protein